MDFCIQWFHITSCTTWRPAISAYDGGIQGAGWEVGHGPTRFFPRKNLVPPVESRRPTKWPTPTCTSTSPTEFSTTTTTTGTFSNPTKQCHCSNNYHINNTSHNQSKSNSIYSSQQHNNNHSQSRNNTKSQHSQHNHNSHIQRCIPRGYPSAIWGILGGENGSGSWGHQSQDQPRGPRDNPGMGVFQCWDIQCQCWPLQCQWPKGQSSTTTSTTNQTSIQSTYSYSCSQHTCSQFSKHRCNLLGTNSQ